MGENVTRYTKTCPNCGNRLGFSSDQTTVRCQCCDSDFSVQELIDSGSSSSVMSAAFAQKNIDTTESGLAYLDSVFGTIDWEDFCVNNPTLFVDSVTAVVDKMKVKFANQPTTWLFEFKSVVVPLQKRFEFMNKTLGEIAEKEDNLENEELISKYDCYCLSAKLIFKNKIKIKKLLELDLRFMKQFKLDSKSLDAVEKEAAQVIKLLDELKETTSVYDLDIVKEKKKKIEKETVERYSHDGINVEEVYADAVKNYLFDNKIKALKSFESIQDYRDAKKYISKLKKVEYPFDGEFIEVAGVTYLFCTSSGQPISVSNKPGCSFAGNKKKSLSSVISSNKGCELYTIVDGVKSEEPIVKDIQRIIIGFGNFLYYIDTENHLVSFDFSSKILTKLTGLDGCNVSEEALVCYEDIGKFVFLAPLEKKESKKGCSFSKKKAQEEQPVSNIARYRFAIVDCYSSTVSYFGENIVAITDKFEKKIFYTQGIFDKDGNIVKKMYYVYDVVTGKCVCPFNREVLVYNVVNNYIIYGLWTPNGLNIDLYSYNLDTTEITLLEKNAYDVTTVEKDDELVPVTIDGYIYYTIGNYEFAPLYRVRPDGTGKKEIMPNVERINFIRNGYFYITKVHAYYFGNGWRYDRTLIKSKVDGTSRKFICSGFKRIVEFKQGYIYYVDFGDNLHIVRADGEQDRVITKHFEKELLINDKNIFFLYSEKVSDKIADYGDSIYVMDLQGRNLHKIAFDVKEAEYHDENNVYYSTNAILAYKVKTPRNNREYNEPVTQTFNVVMYYALNVHDLHLTRLYCAGAPVFDKGSEGKGCKLFRKKVLPTLAEQVEYIYPMPEKTKLSFVDEQQNQEKSSSPLTAALSGGKGKPGCQGSKNGCQGCAPQAARKGKK